MRTKEFIDEGKGLPFPGTYEEEYGMFKKKGPERIIAMTNEADAKKTFVVVYYSKKTDRNVTKQVQANNKSEVWDALQSKGIQVVSVTEKGVAEEKVTEKWSAKYKRSINCNNPTGFSQRAHCQGRKKKK